MIIRLRATDVPEAIYYLTEAKRLLLEVGWCKKTYYKENPYTGKKCAYCLSGAINAVIVSDIRLRIGVKHMLSGILVKTGHSSSFLPDFNDGCETVEDVVKVIDDTILELEDLQESTYL